MYIESLVWWIPTVAVIAVVGLIGSRLGRRNPTIMDRELEAKPEQVQGSTEFTLNLYKEVVKDLGNDNAALSPLSIGIALSMVSAGANGPTLQQIADCIKLPPGDKTHEFSHQLTTVALADGSKAGGPQLASANRVLVEQSIKLKPAFQKILKHSYGSDVGSVDFKHKAEKAREDVNSWAKKQTHGKIENLLPLGALDAQTRIVLANALYFKGMWSRPFEESATKEADFFLMDGGNNSVKVPMMHTQAKQCIRDFPTFKVLRLPYASGKDARQFSMLILLPHDRNGLADLEQNLDTKTVCEDLAHITRQVPVTRCDVPKFKISSQVMVPKALKSLGMSLVFGEHADLSNMVEGLPAGESLYVSNVFHKGFVEVNEKGTEAAAATAVVVATRMCIVNEQPMEFVADHPFLFLIKEEKMNVVVFSGRVTNPLAEN